MRAAADARSDGLRLRQACRHRAERGGDAEGQELPQRRRLRRSLELLSAPACAVFLLLGLLSDSACKGLNPRSTTNRCSFEEAENEEEEHMEKQKRKWECITSERSSLKAKAIELPNYEYRIKPVEEVKYMKNGEGEEDQKIAAKNQENLEKSASPSVRLKANKEVLGLSHPPRTNMHISDSQQEFFRMLDEKIEKGRDYCSEEEDIT
ncbi:hypothetical protein NDU88_004881 [Pleurodeles waltl]|uniref:Uncharacterized protein n=1 Tax=Pleurodeles waltl TaxID=8319 RepID=A0AAV7T9N9_PLEWA|nr:hypothetical protein NDU88_004881 [Pleurodeles waltl]